MPNLSFLSKAAPKILKSPALREGSKKAPRFLKYIARHPAVQDGILSGVRGATSSIPIKSNAFTRLFKGTKEVPLSRIGKYTSQYRAREMDIAARASLRSEMRKSMKKNFITALGKKEYRKTLSSHAGKYIGEVSQDFRHPIHSLRRQSAMVFNHVEGSTGKTVRRSPLGVGVVGATLFGIPLLSSVTEFTDKKNKARPMREKAIRSASYLLPMASPKALPSLLAYQIPEMLYPAKKRSGEQI